MFTAPNWIKRTFYVLIMIVPLIFFFLSVLTGSVGAIYFIVLFLCVFGGFCWKNCLLYHLNSNSNSCN